MMNWDREVCRLVHLEVFMFGHGMHRYAHARKYVFKHTSISHYKIALYSQMQKGSMLNY